MYCTWISHHRFLTISQKTYLRYLLKTRPPLHPLLPVEVPWPLFNCILFNRSIDLKDANCVSHEVSCGGMKDLFLSS